MLHWTFPFSFVDLINTQRNSYIHFLVDIVPSVATTAPSDDTSSTSTTFNVRQVQSDSAPLSLLFPGLEAIPPDSSRSCPPLRA